MKLIKFVIVLFTIFGIGYSTLYYSSQETLDFTVTDKERITTGAGENLNSKYLVFTENEVFENVDDLMFFKFKSSNIQGKLIIGQTYTVKVVGWRIPFLSMYRNIINVKPIKLGDSD